MKIWIDISNAPHVNFFKDFIDEWKEKYEVVVTTRHLSNTIDLLDQHNIEYDIVGSHYGKNKFAKIMGFFKRCNELHNYLKQRNIDIAISQSSFYSPYVANKLKIPSIYTNDNEFAKGNYIGFLLASDVLLPEALKEWAKGRFFENKVSFYPGVKEGIYIKKN
jgi:predicted glycosyltransferase